MEEERCCSDCKATKTPLWRGGPAGPKSLCNACGIRFRKQRRAELLGIRIIQRDKVLASKKISSRRSLKEEEQAAFCLLLLSCGSVFTV